MPFTFRRLEIPDLIVIEPKVFSDARGYFMETYQASTFAQQGIPTHFVQDNLSHSTRSTLRGLHYQLSPKAQGKLVTCLRGDVFDVAVDIRRNSPTYGKWAGVRLTEQNRLMLYVPAGFAHGFCVMSDEADFVYKVTDEYSPSHERGFAWDDPAVGIDWPVRTPVLSAKDQQLPTLKLAENNFTD